LLAGLDCFLVREPAARQIAAWEALVRAAEKRPEVHARILESGARVATFKSLARVGPPASDEALPALLAPPAHQALAASFRGTGGNSAAGSPVAVN
jgi:hypothetical protein